MKGMTKIAAMTSVIIMMLCGATVVFDSSDGEGDVETTKSLIQMIGDLEENEDTIVLTEGTYNFKDPSENSTEFNGKKLTIRAAEGDEGKVVVKLEGQSNDIIVKVPQNESKDGTELHVEGIVFKSEEPGLASVEVWNFWDYTFENCIFDGARLFRESGTNDPTQFGTAKVVGCVFKNGLLNGYAATLIANKIIFHDNVIYDCGRGPNFSLKGEKSSLMVFENNVYNLLDADKKRIAFQVSGEGKGATVLVERNDISDVNYGFSIHDGLKFDEKTDIKLVNNTFTDCIAEIFYPVDNKGTEGEYCSGAKVTFVGDKPPTVATDGTRVEVSPDSVEYIELSPETPSNPGFDDDDEFPFIPGQNQSSGKDDTTTYIAVAAAAAVVAVLAVLVMAMSKGKL